MCMRSRLLDHVDHKLVVMLPAFDIDPKNLAQLRGGNNDGGGVDKAQDDRM